MANLLVKYIFHATYFQNVNFQFQTEIAICFSAEGKPDSIRFKEKQLISPYLEILNQYIWVSEIFTLLADFRT